MFSTQRTSQGACRSLRKTRRQSSPLRTEAYTHLIPAQSIVQTLREATMRSSIQKRLFFVPVCFLLLISCSWAQTGTTSLHGKVLDSTRAVVEGASVTLANQTQGLSRNATTASTGEFEFLALPPGT